MKAFRIVVAEQSAMLTRKFNQEPQVGDVFQMANGSWYLVNSITHDPIEGSNDPDWLIGAIEITAHPWAGGHAD